MARTIKRLSAKERTAFIAAARSYLDVPFMHRGRSRRGVDCIGLVALALADVGRTSSDRRLYGKDPTKDGLRDALVEHFGKPVKEPKPGDVVLMQWHLMPNHVAIVGDYYLGGLSLIHAIKQNDRVVEHRLSDPWPRRIVDGFRP